MRGIAAHVSASTLRRANDNDTLSTEYREWGGSLGLMLFSTTENLWTY